MSRTAALRPEQDRSTFVTVVSWIFIIGAALGMIGALFQFVLFFLLSSSPEFAKGMNLPVGDSSSSASFIVVSIVCAIMFVCDVVYLVSAIGLLKRKNWARIMTLVLLALAILGIILWAIGSGVVSLFGPEAPVNKASPLAGDILRVFQYVMSIFAIILVVFFGWIIKKLTSPKIKAEFGA